MKYTDFRACGSLIALGLALVASVPAFAQSRQVTTPNVTNAAGQVDVVLGGVTFSNKGLLGAGKLDANTRDFRNETLGSFSGMAMNLSTWRRNADGSYNGSIYTLPDRGPFDGGIDYRDRVHTENITFRPLAAGSAALPQVTASQNQVTITPTGGFTLKDTLGVEFTGRNPGASTVTRNGIVYPLATDGTAAGHVSLDPEAIAFLPNGNFYISDEYAAGIYLFDATGKQIGAIQTIPALLPRLNGTINFDALITNVTSAVTGRRGNQGLEAMAITPDNKKLVTILQSATVQDTAGAAQATRNNTRILIYDISSNATPTNPIAHYVLQLPIFNNNGSGAAPDRTAAQSEMLALNDKQFLVLSRDGIGRGVAGVTTPPAASTSSSPVFKSILLVDTTGATNLAGTQYETGTTPIATNGTLLPSIVPVQQVELINMLNPTQLARVGMNANFGPTTTTSLSEKWEAMALAPVLEEGAPQDFFLLVGNDNDFRGTATRFDAADPSTANISTPDGGNNDSTLLVYRLTLPTYVDPQALAALNATAPAMLYGTRLALAGLGASATEPAMRFLNAQNGWADTDQGAPSGGRRMQLWMDTNWSQVGAGASGLTGIDGDILGVTVGFDLPLGDIFRVGAMGGYRKLEGAFAPGVPMDVEAWTVGGYAAAELPSGIYAQAAAAWLGDAKFKLRRASAYDQTGEGRSKGQGWSASGEIGWNFAVGGKGSIGPFAAVDYVDLNLDGYTETGASVSNLVFPDRDIKRLTASFGGELAVQWGALRPAIRAGYSIEDERGDETATVRLASAQHIMGTVALPLVNTERDTAFGELRIAMHEGPWSAYASGRGRWGRGDDEAQVSIGAAYAF
ncbi:MAG: esterase-like activity of phytase family protein [Sphingomonadales bacterium]|nr:esterase-like activity of phytase family protein [Sphingomonadales bacterium]